MAGNKHKGIKKHIPAIKGAVKKIPGEAFIRHGFYIFDAFCRVFSIKKALS
jgi:hypothetical protein